jgi:hypothetical protein
MKIYELKNRDQILTQDPWWDGISILGPTGARKRTMDDHYSVIRTYLLIDNVPTDVVQSFETARNLYLYSFYAHQFLMVSELHAGISVEFALREKAIQESIPIKSTRGMRRLLDLAIEKQWISDKGFQRFQKREAARQHNESVWADVMSPLPNDVRLDPNLFCKSLAEVLPQIRNTLAHGSGMFYYTVLSTFELAADLINQLFDPKRETGKRN